MSFSAPESKFELSATCTEIPTPAAIVTAVERLVTRFKPFTTSTDVTSSRAPNYTPTYTAWCSRLQYYILMQYQKEKLDADDGFSSGFNLFRGNALHDAFARIYRWSELPLKINFPLSHGRSVIISGRLDMYEPTTAEILDLKTTKYLGWQKKSNFVPRLKDLRQLAIYEIMYRKILPVKKLTILYADMADIVAFDLPIPRDTEKWLTDRIEVIEYSRETKIPPPGEVTKLCDYCPFQNRCHNDGGGIVSEPKSKPEDLDLS